MEKNMNHHQCTVCSYVYKPERGDWTHEIKAGTSFEDLPEDWRCPTCNQPKMAFVEKNS
ncbi:rubredoxin [Alkaliphilus hydrothermalis]|uniref:Rubredoxin n=1 Tax=Alkaliphilus hydrothermalis TaxID=1482730 RepID=A0ABS2NS68_9FIRM|nr:rubredoxin [Alkaliphilus hydrothermalis]